MGRAYYNEIDPYAAQWMRNLIEAGHIAPGDVDERSIEDVRPSDLRGYTQCHFFAGIGVWSYALRLAGWPDDRPVWTGSCPCQPFSVAAVAHERAGFNDPRHLAPAWFGLIRECRPDVCFGEQVGSRDGLMWLDDLFDQMESQSYACAAAVTSAAGAGADHIRNRLYFVANSLRARRKGHQSIECVSVATQAAFAESGNAAARIRAAMAGDYTDLLPSDEPSIALERVRAKGYGNAINARTAALFIQAADEAMSYAKETDTRP
ncbi:DNA cytosine methyltransferase [Caballeronia sp. LZ001]|uniref:DNA cytosine methyltransferase n=1 Tax=Caballeronia sp. LZ001 TaxID=3038553 RepID=UPI00285F2806|nr:DNA cytosine methyltransferase [Caballeronia sp. LZ001]MDR5801160.1 DNA cytosine methyltransferase [Caballeronia sp. LZ001]